MLRRFILPVLGLIVILGVGAYAAFRLSPWPSVWLIRHSVDAGAQQARASVAARVPRNVTAHYGLSYDPADPDALFDVFAPLGSTKPLPAVVWVHGGGFIAGSRADLSGYLQVLAARGYVVVAIDYTLAPEAQFPTPVRQANRALAHIAANAARFGIDPGRIFLAGDSAGAQIASQAALAISAPAYAERIGVEPGLPRASLRGVVLFCGPYDPGSMNFDGSFGNFMRTVIWSYAGTRDPHDARVAQLSVTPHVVANYPPAFISVGNADPLAPQSIALAQALRAAGSEVETLFFPPDHKPSLDHEYQLLLSTEAGQLALDRYSAFLATHARGISEGGPMSPGDASSGDGIATGFGLLADEQPH